MSTASTVGIKEADEKRFKKRDYIRMLRVSKPGLNQVDMQNSNAEARQRTLIKDPEITIAWGNR